MAVSSLVPAAAGITVADGNTAGWGRNTDNWTLLGRQTTGAASHNFTSLGGYKKIRINMARMELTSNTAFRMQINGDTAGNYSQADAFNVTGSTTNINIQTSFTNSFFYALRNPGAGSQITFCEIVIDNADSTVGTKHVTFNNVYNDASFGQVAYVEGQGDWNNLAAVTSINLYVAAGITNLAGANGFIEVWGSN